MRRSERAAPKLALGAEAPPLRQDANGDLRVGASRVLVDVVITAFFEGATPETIASRYPTAELADLYGVIAYFLRHRERIEAYLAERERRAAEVRKRVEARRGKS